MSPSISLRGRHATVSIAVLLLVLTTSPSVAQMALESMVPAHGSENVDTQQPIVLRFSQSLDTLASFGGFFIGAQVSPPVGEPESYSLNEARTELTIQVDLADDTQYWFVLIGAEAESGDAIDHPYAWTFSTGTLPTGSISGTVTFPESTPANSIVVAFQPDFFAGMFGDDEEDGDDGPQFRAAAIVTESDGSFQIDYVPNETLVPGAFRDVNYDGEPDVDVEGEGLGFYDADGDRVADEISVMSGQPVSGIDIEIRSGGTTAGELFGDVAGAAQGVQTDAALSGIQGGEVTPDGEAGVWLYLFYAPATEDTLGVALFWGYLFPLEDVMFGDDEGPLDPTSILPDEWIDSSVALETAEDAGGATYRAENEGVMITAGLFNFDPDMGGGAGKSWSIAERRPIWFVSYNAESNPSPLQILMDGETGEVLFVMGLASTAAGDIEAANGAALAWQADAQLVLVTTQAPIDPAGRSFVWVFAYHSPSADAVRAIFVSGGSVLDQRDATPEDVPSVVPLPGFWVNSDAAVAAADAASADFRNQNPDAEVFARLTRGLSESNPDRLLWEFSYTAVPEGEILLRILVDAVTGMVTTASERDELQATRPLIELYPNPTAATVTIRYELQTVDEVDIVVSNVLGQTVRHLVHGQRPSGSHTLQWDGTDDTGTPAAAGTYWCRLQTSRGVRSAALVIGH